MINRSEEKPLLEIKNLKVEYRTLEGTVYAVNGLDLSMKKGRVFGLVGETGAGKTTTALAIMGLLPVPPAIVTEGEIIFKDKDLLKISEKYYQTIRGNEITMVFQNPISCLNPLITVGHQIAEVINHHQKIGIYEALIQAVEMLNLVGIPKDRLGNYPHQFSGGMKQRVMIAMAVACNPTILIADEATTALDVTIQAQIVDLLKKLISKLTSSLLLITHDFGLVAELCDEVGVMYAGRIVESGPITEIFDNFYHPYVKGLFEALPQFNETTSRLRYISGLSPDPKKLPTGCSFSPRCPQAVPKCFKDMPELITLDDNHKIACWNKLRGGNENDSRS
jgi:peptide/nickel transport system ATP-binding protein